MPVSMDTLGKDEFVGLPLGWKQMLQKSCETDVIWLVFSGNFSVAFSTIRPYHATVVSNMSI